MEREHVRHIQRQVQQSYTAIAGEFDATRQQPWPEFQHFLAYVRKGARVLDAGCGNGRLAGLLAEKQADYLGIDHNSALLDRARRNYPNHRFELADIMDDHWGEAGAFDNVFCVAAFHHVPGRRERQKTADHFYRLLREDGVLILTVWNLFQLKYAGALLKATVTWLLHLGFKTAWNDLWIKWGQYPLKRYYHAFFPRELRSFFPSDRWRIEDFYFTRKGARVPFWRSFNLVLIARKIN